MEQNVNRRNESLKSEVKREVKNGVFSVHLFLRILKNKIFCIKETDLYLFMAYLFLICKAAVVPRRDSSGQAMARVALRRISHIEMRSYQVP